MGIYTHHFLINNQRFCNQWYDQAAQPKNMTFSQRKSWAEKSFDFDNFSIIFLFHFAWVMWDNCSVKPTISSFPWILSLPLVFIFNLIGSV